MRRNLIVVSVLTAGGLTLLTGAAQAAPAGSKPPVAPVAHTAQTVFLGDFSGMGTYNYQTEIDFSTSTFTIPEFGDSGTFKNQGSSLSLKITSSPSGDKGCSFTSSYDTDSTRYVGSYTCKHHQPRNNFAVTSTGTST